MTPVRFQKYLAVATTLALCAFVGATVLAATSLVELAQRATGVLLRRAQTPLSPRVAAAPPPQRDAQPAAAARPLESINFVSTQEVKPAEPLPEVVVPRCPGSLRLVGSVVDARDPERSLAAIRMNGGTRLTPVDARVANLTLIEIGRSHAYFRRKDGSACQLPVFLPRSERTYAPAPAKKAAAPAQPSAAKRAAAEMAELNAGIRQLGPNAFAVTREGVTKALGSVTALRRSARFRMKQENGRTVGMELVRMRKDSPLQRLGLRPGDVLRKLNGHDMTAPDGALQAMQTVKSQDRFSLSVLRGGAPQMLSYEVR